MSKDRNIICKNYIAAGVCSLGKICFINKEMQHCSLYEKTNKAVPFRKNIKKQKIEKIRKEEWK